LAKPEISKTLTHIARRPTMADSRLSDLLEMMHSRHCVNFTIGEFSLVVKIERAE
jgi:hypothetical protein